LQLAKSLIDNLTGEFNPEEFTDEYREKVESLVRQKIEGKEITVVEEAGTAKVLDLIEALKASVEATSGKEAEVAAG
jgi:DNA end-binding protein Ku